MKTTILSVDDIKAIILKVGLDQLMDEAIERLTTVCREYEPRNYKAPLRDGFAYREPFEGLLEWMPAMTVGHQATIKVVGYHPTNPKRVSLPTILSSVLTFDTETGHLIGLADGTFMTALRTGAASAIASRILASSNSRRLGMIGCGAQAVTQIHALSRIFNFEEILVCDVELAASQSLRERVALVNFCGARLKMASREEVVRSADILCTATSVGCGQGPVFQDIGLKSHLHVNAVGSDFPGKTELPLSVLKRSLVCPDFRPQAVAEGECQQLEADEIGPDLVELVKSAATYGAQRENLTVFDSTGWALEDHVVVGMLLQYGRDMGCGITIQLESVSEDPKDPYGFIVDSRGADWHASRREARRAKAVAAT